MPNQIYAKSNLCQIKFMPNHVVIYMIYKQKILSVTLFLNELFELICLHTIKWSQVLLFNISNSTFQVFQDK